MEKLQIGDIVKIKESADFADVNKLKKICVRGRIYRIGKSLADDGTGYSYYIDWGKLRKIIWSGYVELISRPTPIKEIIIQLSLLEKKLKNEKI